ncbi:MAG: hypothetical protein DI640_04910 [Sphingomonas taxi]|uniref:Uncharacterized protein n=1 Tax=Sphingomonas taxi TaxID=1549858 RepID=A0A2W4YZZ9_9SPHN|nr:MAG: hypothetical protein DI640_04910 [Sphingomonas taxi]
MDAGSASRSVRRWSGRQQRRAIGDQAGGRVFLFLETDDFARSGNAEGDTLGVLEGEPLYHGSLHPDEYRMLLNANGFDVVAHVVDNPDCGNHIVWLARRRSTGRG